MNVVFLERHWRGVSVACIIAATAFVYWPALHSAFYLDDFFLVAVARLVDNPLAAFVHSHFPGNVFYRPLGMFFWWLTIHALGNSPLPQYAVNLALHIGISIALWRLLCRCTQARWSPLVAALAFALHPVAIGTSLWLSDRFDLLAVLFCVLALDSAWRYRQRPVFGTAALTFVCAILATLSKETGLAVFASIALLWIWPRENATGARRQQVIAAIAMPLLAVVLLAWRSFVLGAALNSDYFSATSVVQVVTEGFVRWGLNLFRYVAALPRQPAAGSAAEALGFVLLGGGVVAAALSRVRRINWRSDRVVFAFASGVLLLCTGLLQAPVIRAMPLLINSTAHFALDSRLFYFSLLALTILVFLACSCACEPDDRKHLVTGRIVACAVILCIVPLARDARGLARQFRHETLAHMPLIAEALTAVEVLPLGAGDCSVFALGIPEDQKFLFEMQFDAAMKALAPDVVRMQRCRFTGERTPWFYVLKQGALESFDAALPMRPLYLSGTAVPWPSFGGVEIAYLNLFDSIDASSLKGSRFVLLQQDHFVDVTGEVLAGKRSVAFHCGRRREQCSVP